MTASLSISLDQVRRLLTARSVTVTFGVSAYNEGAAIVATLDSLWAGMQELGLDASPLLLSDSSSDPSTVQAAEEWARSTSANLVIHHSDSRRSLKAALNVILNNCHSDLLVVTVGDVVIPTSSLVVLLGTLLSEQHPDVVVGVSWPDPSIRGLRYRAGAWQLRVVQKLAALAPADEVRAEGALWGASRGFYEKFRYPEGSGSIYDDIELQRAVVAGGYRGANASSALVYKIPPGTLRDFCLQTRRYYCATGDRAHKRTKRDWLALISNAGRDPVGAVLYCVYRCYAALFAQQFALSTNTEVWESSITTKRVITSDGVLHAQDPPRRKATRYVIASLKSGRQVAPPWVLRIGRLWRLLRHAGTTGRQVAGVCRAFKNWPTFLMKVGLSYFGLARGNLMVVVRHGPSIVCRNNTESWLPIFEIFVEDVYRLSESPEERNSPLCIVDIGGHVGCFTLAVATRFPNAIVQVYEPSQVTYQYLCTNVYLNGLTSRVGAVEAAVATHAGREHFYEAGDASCGSSLFQAVGSTESMVDVVDFNVVMAEVGHRIDILKIDCEGGEYDIILNSDRDSWRQVQKLLLEYHPVPGHSFMEVEARLVKFGFELYWRKDTATPGIGMAAFVRSR